MLAFSIQLHLDASTAPYFHRAPKNSVHKPTDNLSNDLFQKKMLLQIFDLPSLYKSFLIGLELYHF